jgi:hypothetical protein
VSRARGLSYQSEIAQPLYKGTSTTMYTYCVNLVLNTLNESQDAGPKKLPLEGSFVFKGKSKGEMKVIRGYTRR